MKNITELRDELVKTFQDLKARKIDIQPAKTMVGVSNYILKSAAGEKPIKVESIANSVNGISQNEILAEIKNIRVLLEFLIQSKGLKIK